MKPPLREPFRAQPKALAIVGQKFQRRAGTVTKHIDRAAQRILVQYLATQSGESIDAFPKVDGLHGQEDATLGRKLEH
jgi:hypothetical protein